MINPKENEFQMRCLYLTLARTKSERDNSAMLFIRVPSYVEIPGLRERNLELCEKLFGNMRLENEWGTGDERHSLYSVKYDAGIEEFVNIVLKNYSATYRDLLGPTEAEEWISHIKESQPTYSAAYVVDPDSISDEEIKAELTKAISKNPDIPEEELKNGLKTKRAEKKTEFVYAKALSSWLVKIAAPMQASYIVQRSDKTIGKALKPMVFAGNDVFAEEIKKWNNRGILGATVFQPSPYPIRKNFRASLEEGTLKLYFPWTMGINGMPLLDNVCSYFRKNFRANVSDSRAKRAYAGDPYGLNTMWTRELTISDDPKKLMQLYPFIEAGLNGLFSCYLVKSRDTERALIEAGYRPIKGEKAQKTAEKLGTQVMVSPASEFSQRREAVTEKQKKDMVIEDRIVPYPNKRFVYVQTTMETGQRLKEAFDRILGERPESRGEFELMNRDRYYRCSISDEGMDSYEERVEYAKGLKKEVARLTGVSLPVKSPNIDAIEAYIAGVPGEFDSKMLKVKVPHPMDDDSIDEFENGDKKVSKETRGLFEFEEMLSTDKVLIDGKKRRWKKNEKDLTTLFSVPLPKNDPEKVYEITESVLGYLREKLNEINEENGTSLSMDFVDKKAVEKKKAEKIVRSNIQSWRGAFDPDNDIETYEERDTFVDETVPCR